MSGKTRKIFKGQAQPQLRPGQPQDFPMMSWLGIYTSRGGVFSLDSMIDKSISAAA